MTTMMFKRILSLISQMTMFACLIQAAVPAAELELLDLAETVRGSTNREQVMIDAEGSYWQVLLDDSLAHRDAITGFYGQLLANFRTANIKNAGNLKGVVLCTDCDVTSLTTLNTKVRHAPFLNDWSAELLLSYVFGLTQDNGFSLSLNGGYAKSIDGIRVSARRVAVGVAVNWYAKSRKLTVEVWDLDDPRDTGEQYLESRYFVTGRSINSTLSTKQNLDLNYSLKAQPKKNPDDKSEPTPPAKQTIGIAGSSYNDLGKKRMRVVTEGCSCLLAYGRFEWVERRRSDGSLRIDISFGAEMVSEADLSVKQTLQEKSAQCKGERSITGSVTFTDKVTDAAASLSNSVDCGVDVTAVPYDVSFSIVPSLDRNKPESQQKEGIKSQCRWCVDTATRTGWYQPLFRNGLTYRFSATAANGGSSASILVKSDSIDSRLTKKKYLPTTWK